MLCSYIRQRLINDEYILYWHSSIFTYVPKKLQSEVKNKMRQVDVKALPIIAFALTGRIVLLGLIVRRTGVRRSAYYKIGVI